MIVTKTTQKTKCDFSGCKNLANFTILNINDSKNKMCFCDNCLKVIYEAYAQVVIPKAVEAPFKKQKKLR